MKGLTIFLSLGLLCLSLRTNAQSFWEKKEISFLNFPNEYSSCIQVYKQSKLLLGTNNGLYSSSNNGDNWQELFNEGPVNKIVCTESKIYILVGLNRIYSSDIEGSQWSLIFENNESNITDFKSWSDSIVYVSTGHVETTNGNTKYRGAGLFKTSSYGNQWEEIELGVQSDRYLSEIVIDSSGRIILSSHEYNYHDGIIIISDNQAANWDIISSLKYDAGGINETNLVYFSDISLNKQGEIYISFSGTIGMAATQMTLFGSIDSLINGEVFQHLRRSNSGFEWFYNESHQIFFIEETIFSNRIGSSNDDGLLIKRNDHYNFSSCRLDQLFNIGLKYNECSIVYQNGNIYAIQKQDRYLYRAPINQLYIKNNSTGKLNIYPNPTNDKVTIDLAGSTYAKIQLYNNTGQLIKEFESQNNLQYTIDLSEFPACAYTIMVHENSMISKGIILIK
ncbi:T9SS type A sorting domain-containing protein [Paracrocinitomix mangrovi]|uniref:T9SS type A sorting domain-containing protein n=1 Tax=Paracrocinitomix mangrovi TaxID=2862509 RepID=UPI001C8E8533|nr:T9SS type A sorting domain-containing protein [Paracrocinitomix mangrovi]UKN02260.1 T9SS type A sorting domain-containing protein [Paracrocinitomix mangrovi]